MATHETEGFRQKSNLDLYLSDISKFRLLTPEEERDLGRRIQQGDADAHGKLVEANLRFVVKIAKQYRNSGVCLEDLINEGNMGLMQAASRFDPSREVRFISYAVWWIHRSIQYAISSMAHPIRLPVKMHIIARKAGAVISQFLLKEGRYPSEAELSEELGVNSKLLKAVLEASGRPFSLNVPLEENGDLSMQDLMASPDETEKNVFRQMVEKQIKQALGDLAANEERVLRMRFGFEGQPGRTLRQIGERIGLSRERVRQLQQKGLHKLRNHAKARSVAALSFSNP